MSVFEYFKSLVSIPSPSKGEGAISEYALKVFSSFGYQHKKDEAGNILFFKNTIGEKVLLGCHMDTVPIAVDAHLVEDEKKFKTDGTTALGADDKAAFAALIDFAEHYEGDRAIILCCVAEEIGLWGSSKLEKTFLAPFDIKYSYILDAQTSVGGIVASAIGKSRLTINVTGKSAHAGFSPEDGINAIKVASEICTKIECGRLGERTTCNIGSFISNGSTNVVPANATILLEVRSDSDTTRYSILEGIKATSVECAKKYNAKVDFLDEDLYSPYFFEEDNPLIQKAIRALEAIGRTPEIKRTTGGSDANNLNKIGIPTVVLTSGYFNAHSTSEYIEKEELKALRKLIEHLVKD